MPATAKALATAAPMRLPPVMSAARPFRSINVFVFRATSASILSRVVDCEI